MKAAIIAAGQGERLRAADDKRPKPLVAVAGRALIDHTLAGIHAADIRDVACIVNEESIGIEEHCRSRWPDVRFEFLRKTTPNSMESVFALASLLGDSSRFLLTTVDSIVAPEAYRRFCDGAPSLAGATGTLAVTRHVDDEKPLWAQLDDKRRIVRLGDAARPTHWITAGLYILEPTIFREIPTARRAGFNALRLFLGHLIDRGYPIFAHDIGKTLDVDRPEDIAAAEAFIASGYADQGP